MLSQSKITCKTHLCRVLAKFAFLAIAIVLSGCQSHATRALVADAADPAPKAVTIAQANRCIKDLNRSALGQRIFSQIFYSDVVAPQYTQLMTLNRYLSEAEVGLLKEFIEQNKECRSLRIQAFREYEFRAQLLIFHAEMDAMFDDVLNRRITIGQSNTQSQQIRERYLIEINKIYKRSREIDEESLG